MTAVNLHAMLFKKLTVYKFNSSTAGVHSQWYDPIIGSLSLNGQKQKDSFIIPHLLITSQLLCCRRLFV